MKTLKIKIYSEGGQGIRSMVERIEKDTFFKNLFITSLVKYDSIVKGGTVETNLIFSEQRISSPFFDFPDFYIILKKGFLEKDFKEKDFFQKEDFKKNEVEIIEEVVKKKVEEVFSLIV